MTEHVAVTMRRLVDEATAKGSYRPMVIAAEVVAKLRANDPELLDAWLQDQAETFVWQMINDRDRSIRGRAARRRGARAFATAAAAGDVGGYLSIPFTIEDGQRRRLGELTHDDLAYVAGRYRTQAGELIFRATVIEAMMIVVARSPGTTVQDHYTDAQLATMWGSE